MINETIMTPAMVAHLMGDHEVNAVLVLDKHDEDDESALLKIDRESLKQWAATAERLPLNQSWEFNPKEKTIILSL